MKKIIIILLLTAISVVLKAQSFIPIWEGSSMPNSRGVVVKDSIANERIFHVGTPGFYVFESTITENKGAAVLIIPGGGYARLAYQVSGFQLAKWFNTFGVTAFVLNHRLPQSIDVVESHKAPLQDTQRAIKYIRENASRWNIEADKIGVIGSSAGGHLAACVSTINEDMSKVGDSLDNVSFLPNYTILVSPVISMTQYLHKGSRNNLLGENPSDELLNLFSCDKQVTADTPPAFMVHANNDNSVPSMNSILYYSALKQHDVKGASLHIFPEGGHSIALRNNPGTTNDWTSLAEKWLKEIGILKD